MFPGSCNSSTVWVLLWDKTFVCNPPGLVTLALRALKCHFSSSDPALKILSCELWHSLTSIWNPPHPGAVISKPLPREWGSNFSLFLFNLCVQELFTTCNHVLFLASQPPVRQRVLCTIKGVLFFLVVLPALAVCVVSFQTPDKQRVWERQWPLTLCFSIYRKEPASHFPKVLWWFPLEDLRALPPGLVVGTVRIQSPCFQPWSCQVHRQHSPERYTTPLPPFVLKNVCVDFIYCSCTYKINYLPPLCPDTLSISPGNNNNKTKTKTKPKPNQTK